MLRAICAQGKIHMVLLRTENAVIETSHMCLHRNSIHGSVVRTQLLSYNCSNKNIQWSFGGIWMSGPNSSNTGY